ncbi:MAG: hypothetical protein N4A72_20865 [Bacteroidales bacterium]|jgi:hypothetical protein|nr:hypothetical protein [Bacteroidales bacterium]
MKQSMRIVIHTHDDDYKCEFHLANEKQLQTDETKHEKEFFTHEMTKLCEFHMTFKKQI